MRIIWTLLKVVIALAIAIPLSIIVLGTALGILGAMVALAIIALKFAIIGLVAWGAFRLVARLVRGPAGSVHRQAIPEAPPVDRHYEAAMRELDQELRA
jgi:hypothetical protein